jgi:dihydrofolate reductase / thymidylate synthase
MSHYNTHMKFNIIVAYDVERGIGKNGQMPWKIPNDLARFKELTTRQSKNCVIMGRKTWESIPQKFRPLQGRTNIILTKSEGMEHYTSVEKSIYVCRSFDDLDILCSKLELDEAFFIGGEQIYKIATQRYLIHRYYLTQIMKKYGCDTFFPIVNASNYNLTESQIYVEKDVPYRFQTYEWNKPLNNLQNTENEEEKAYLSLLKDVLSRGQYRDDRTAVGTLSLFVGKQLTFDISKCFPLLTTKRVFYRGVAEELFFFLSGLTNAQILQERDVHIWDENSSREYLDKIGQKHRKVGDLGKFYGYQWRHWGAQYTDCDQDYTGKGFDQIKMIIDLIKKSPTSRRIIISAWNPADLPEVCLPPCHLLYQFYVDTENKTLSCSMYQR